MDIKDIGLDRKEEKAIIKSVIKIKKIYKEQIDTAIILGSGLSGFVDNVDVVATIPYKSLPAFPLSRVSGHKNRLVIGTISNKTIAILQGRFHLYEGISARQISLPIYVLSAIGVKILIITNAAGSLDKKLQPGSLALISNHINLSGQNPLIGLNVAHFIDISYPYDRNLMEIAKSAAKKNSIPLHEGVYTILTGPSYETAAEIDYLKKIGATMVGMSTVPEVITARLLGIRVLGISMVSNYGAGISRTPLSHKEVIETGAKAASKLTSLIEALIPLIK